MKDRIDAIDLRLAVYSAGLNYKNTDKLKKHLIKNDDDALMTKLEDGYASYLAEESVKFDKYEVEQIGLAVRSACDRALNVVIGTNVKTGKKRADRKQMRESFADILKELKEYELGESIKLVKLLPTDAFYVTAEMKTHVLEILEGALP